jgi:hypothetical protein
MENQFKFAFIQYGTVLGSVVDPDPDPVGAGTFCRIRIRNK